MKYSATLKKDFITQIGVDMSTNQNFLIRLHSYIGEPNEFRTQLWELLSSKTEAENQFSLVFKRFLLIIYLSNYNIEKVNLLFPEGFLENGKVFSLLMNHIDNEFQNNYENFKNYFPVEKFAEFYVKFDKIKKC